jgi:hypothetical protein
VWQRPFLLTLGVLELIVVIPTAVFGLILGYHGFVAGEMGTMVGILVLAVLVPLLLYGVLRVFSLFGLWKRRRWGAALVIVLAVMGALGGFIAALDTPGLLVVILIYAGATGWAAIGCLRHPSFNPGSP